MANITKIGPAVLLAVLAPLLYTYLLVMIVNLLSPLQAQAAGIRDVSPTPLVERNVVEVTEEVIVTTEKNSYQKNETVWITISNRTTESTFGWLGPCGVKLQENRNGTWQNILDSWSGCPSCGEFREIPEPRFIRPGNVDRIKWDQKISRCTNGTTEKVPVVGKLRVMVRYAKDRPHCNSALSPFKCWLQFKQKSWRTAVSNEFTLGG